MINNAIRGGQLQMHRIRMLLQVLGKSLKWSFYFACILTAAHLYFFNLESAKAILPEELFSYAKVHVVYQIDQLIAPLRNSKILNLGKRPENMVEYRTSSGLQRRPVKAAIHDKTLLTNFAGAKRLAMSEAKVLGIGYLVFNAMIIIYWTIAGKIQREGKSDRRYLTAEEVTKFLKKHKLASWLKIGPIPMVRDSETQHVLLMGTTGTGKTNCMRNMLSQIEAKGQRALVLDQTGELIARYYNKARGDIIFNPTHTTSATWDFFSEMKDKRILYSFASNVFASTLSNQDPIWGETARQIFTDTVTQLMEEGVEDPIKLYKLLNSPIERLRSVIKDRPSSSYLVSSNEKTAMSMLSTVKSKIDWLELLETKGEKFTIQDYVNRGTGWLFISSDIKTRRALQSLRSSMFDLAVIYLMELGPSKTRRLWFIMDELASMSKLTALSQALAELRKYGGSVVAGLQSMLQLTDIYSYSQARVIQSQFNTQVYFRMGDPELARIVSESFGQSVHHKQQESISYGAHEMRDGVQIGQLEKAKPILAIEELLNLKNLECFVALPEPEVLLTKLQIPYAE